jgi:hypothetical protein
MGKPGAENARFTFCHLDQGHQNSPFSESASAEKQLVYDANPGADEAA